MYSVFLISWNRMSLRLSWLLVMFHPRLSPRGKEKSIRFFFYPYEISYDYDFCCCVIDDDCW